MITKRTYKHVTWIDMLSPTPEEVRELIETYNLNPDVSNNMLLPSLFTKIYDYEGLTYLVLHFPTRSKAKRAVLTREVDFLLAKDIIATIRYEHNDAIEQFAKNFDVSIVLGKQNIPHAGFVFMEIVKYLYNDVNDEIGVIDGQLQEIEPKVFNDQEKQVVNDLSILNHSLLQFKQTISPHKELLEMTMTFSEEMFGGESSVIGKTLISEHTKTIKDIEHRKENLKELWDTNAVLLSTKQNEIMKNLAMVSFITFPLTLIVAGFELFTHLSDNNSSSEFWRLIALLLIATAAMIFFFKRKRWI